MEAKVEKGESKQIPKPKNINTLIILNQDENIISSLVVSLFRLNGHNMKYRGLKELNISEYISFSFECVEDITVKYDFV